MNPKIIPELTEFERRLFHKKIKIGGNSFCWIWTSNKVNGYGRVTIRKQSYLAHRVSYFIQYGSIPDGKLLLHKCDNPSCVNPAHLIPGTHLENMKESSARRRAGTNANAQLYIIELLMRERGIPFDSSISTVLNVEKVLINYPCKLL